ncbi:anti-sigma factor family protein [Dictyobacter formicarum]|uniref:Zinc-finger domain-containing protein n=1 Tax=Dictyobacter formicarum TaxID=2778368 RepID=A0ABQ3VU93_9CHLR|nr:hypothetical protein [Dictyobacter formicarum]GHO88666.1 hypothetical protein KSZ_66720 [Dictyobacter formicarum]
MNQKDDRADMQTSTPKEHHTVKALLDAYSAAELVENEKSLVAHHLESCQQCQRELDDISRLHSLLKLPDVDIQAATLKGYSTMPEYKRGISDLADSVLDRLAQQDQEDAAIKALPSIGQSQQAHPTASRHTLARRKRWPRLLALVAAAMCVAVLSVLCIPPISQFISTNTHNGAGGVMKQQAPIIWRVHQDQTVARHGQDVFALLFASVVNEREFVLFYAFRTSHPGMSPQVKVVSTLPAQPGESITIPDRVQALGSVGDFAIGVIHVQMPDRLGQSITLQGTFPDQATPWHLTILDQNSKLPPVSNQPYGASMFYIDPKSLPEITQVYPFMNPSTEEKNTTGDNHLWGLFGFVLSSRPQTGSIATPLYVRVDYSVKHAALQVTAISYADYMRLAGPQPTPTPRPTAAPGSTVHVSVNKASYRRSDSITVTITSDFPYTVFVSSPRGSCTMMVQLEMLVNGVWSPVGHCAGMPPSPMMPVEAGKATYQHLQPQNSFGWQHSASSWQPGIYRISTNYSTTGYPKTSGGLQKAISPTFIIN